MILFLCVQCLDKKRKNEANEIKNASSGNYELVGDAFNLRICHVIARATPLDLLP